MSRRKAVEELNKPIDTRTGIQADGIKFATPSKKFCLKSVRKAAAP